MRLRLTILALTLTLGAAGPAAAQGFSGIQPAPSQGFGTPPSQGFGAPPAPNASRPNPFDAPQQARPNPFDAPQQQEPPCFKQFSALRTESEKRGKAVQEAGKRKAPAPEVCKLFNALVASEVKLIKYVETNLQACGIPAQVSDTLKAGHAKVTEIRDRVCAVAAQPRSAGPSLSDALGTTRSPDSSNVRTGHGGTFDTLTGSPIGR